MKKILVTGANGNYGKAVIESLIKNGTEKSAIFALVRSEEKAEELKAAGVNVRIGDYNDYQSLVNAFSGIDKVLLVSGTDVQNRSEQQRSVVKAAGEAGVSHILYTSVERKTDSNESPLGFVLDSHKATEDAIIASGIPYTFLRNNLYMDILPMFLGEKVLETGVYFPSGEGKAGFALRSEMAEAAANILTSEGHENKAYDISGTNGISFGEIAEKLSDVSGKTIGFHSPENKEYIEALTGAGVPAEFAMMFGGFADAIKQGELQSGNSDMERLLGRKPTSVADFLSSVYSRN